MKQPIPILKKVKPPADDTLVSDAMMQEVVRRVLRRSRVVRTYDVPYLGGSSKSGTIYIDRRLPRSFRTAGRRVTPDPFIILHEAVERVVGDALTLTYQQAHQIAMRVEEAAIRAAGISWHDYNAFLRKYEEIVAKDFSSVPPDLDLKPYRDDGDAPTLKHIRELLKKRTAKRPKTGA